MRKVVNTERNTTMESLKKKWALLVEMSTSKKEKVRRPQCLGTNAAFAKFFNAELGQMVFAI